MSQDEHSYTKAIIILVLLSSLASAIIEQKGPSGPQDNLIGAYHLDNTNWVDSSGNNYDGRQNGTVTISDGIYFNASTFNGDFGNFIVLPYPDISPENYTISFWFKLLNYVGVNQVFIGSSNGGANTQILLVNNSGVCKLRGSFRDNLLNSTLTEYYFCPNINTWYNMVFIKNGTMGDLYLNGLFVNTSTNPNVTNSVWASNLSIGANPVGGSRTNSTVDEVLIYNIPLTSTQIFNLYKAAFTELNFTSPPNQSSHILPEDQILNIYGIIGLGDKTAAGNIIYKTVNGTWYTLRSNAGVETNYSFARLTYVNTTHYLFWGRETLFPGSYNVSLNATGGNQIVTSDQNNLFFSVTTAASTTSTVTTSIPGTPAYTYGASTSYMQDFFGGRPLQAIRNVFTDLMGGLFYAVMMGVLYVGVWLRTRSIIFPTLLLDIIMAGFMWSYMPSQVQTILYALNILTFGVILYKLVAPVVGD